MTIPADQAYEARLDASVLLPCLIAPPFVGYEQGVFGLGLVSLLQRRRRRERNILVAVTVAVALAIGFRLGRLWATFDGVTEGT